MAIVGHQRRTPNPVYQCIGNRSQRMSAQTHIPACSRLLGIRRSSSRAAHVACMLHAPHAERIPLHRHQAARSLSGRRSSALPVPSPRCPLTTINGCSLHTDSNSAQHAASPSSWTPIRSRAIALASADMPRNSPHPCKVIARTCSTTAAREGGRLCRREARGLHVRIGHAGGGSGAHRTRRRAGPATAAVEPHRVARL